MDFEFNSEQDEFKTAEWQEAIKLYNWRNPLNKGHYERRKGVIYFDAMCYNLMETQIERRTVNGTLGQGQKFYV